ncbi:hypothetical protein GCM10010274_47660 [Streptomyces lavendofoliae]|uniref:Uncharacterized protein n=1 Tax=Streptomyces lavendofoliae TaxID=67314 RepID=A0A918I153_9ACTN|nr:hypothetical protein GCM10010274_47660 [Streptomyces lavendofoliae]
MEASIVAVRRGMERQYGTRASVHPWGRSVRGDAQERAQTVPLPEWDFSITSRKRA